MDTIVARGTPPGSSAIAIVRISGPETFRLCAALFRPRHGSLERLRSGRRPALGDVWVDGQVVDEALLWLMAAPRSYTGEDSAELFLHGSDLLVELVLRCLCEQGGRLARPGEFTKRAFVNGKMSLDRASAVQSVVEAGSVAEIVAARRVLDGAFGQRVMVLRERLLNLRLQVEMRIDFPEEEDPTHDEVLLAELESLGVDLDALVRACEGGDLLRRGLSVVLTGAPNVGKSSLLNRILGEERAIVTEVPGTTRDVVEGRRSLGGLSVLFRDTAGVRETSDPVERVGVARAMEARRQADLVLQVWDASGAEGASEVVELESRRVWVLLNKCDRGVDGGVAARAAALGVPVIRTSAAVPGGVDELLGALEDTLVRNAAVRPQESFVVGRWVNEGLVRVRDRIGSARELIGGGGLDTALGFVLDGALAEFDQLLGLRASDDLMDRIFSTFCLGK